ncbi:hypothetical protein GALMADRAFT_1254171 [Galerina marginata CBS 339.88]|uniref:Uncharacterized protein n=1 Tax=Galerina marginata (strain CBS 339.88) TaxID=685588 RepID=A0A067T5S9_GALM3|nr:hypothetical protein GALMADRAFT_1254171 [Galerina marginata CBS 339.88]
MGKPHPLLCRHHCLSWRPASKLRDDDHRRPHSSMVWNVRGVFCGRRVVYITTFLRLFYYYNKKRLPTMEYRTTWMMNTHIANTKLPDTLAPCLIRRRSSYFYDDRI